MREDLLPKTIAGGRRKLIQEAAEVIKAVTKLEDFGETARDPVTEKEYDNVEDLLGEINDLEHAIAEVKAYYARRGRVYEGPVVAIRKLKKR